MPEDIKTADGLLNAPGQNNAIQRVKKTWKPHMTPPLKRIYSVRDSVLVKQYLSSKASPPYEGEPLEVQHRKVTQVVVKRRDGSTIARSIAHFKKVAHQTLDEVGRSQLEPGFGRKASAELQAEELPKPQE
ncbi:hypothetical protein AWC38_SpisGene14235 [Stylophora pistillata]|uniref:Uncharacterized protein n=1 Tax=Stylophora pistillata TaxID=50429 RepID=A0A2B4RYG6_STYPI|nr:hypothetical protein AWC38_SpisGene14235 [Stylophora pistillata]